MELSIRPGINIPTILLPSKRLDWIMRIKAYLPQLSGKYPF